MTSGSFTTPLWDAISQIEKFLDQPREEHLSQLGIDAKAL